MVNECRICGARWKTPDYDFGQCPVCAFNPARAVGEGAAEVWYLASPYTHTDPAVQAERVYYAARIAARLAARGTYTIPAMVIGAGLAGAVPTVGTTWADWQTYDEALLSLCSGVIVCMIPGWRESVGVQAEIAWAIARGRPVRYVDTDGEVGNVR